MHAMKVRKYGEAWVWLYSVLALAMDGGEVTASAL
jgi:hypothetical protein